MLQNEIRMNADQKTHIRSERVKLFDETTLLWTNSDFSRIKAPQSSDEIANHTLTNIRVLEAAMRNSADRPRAGLMQLFKPRRVLVQMLPLWQAYIGIQ